MFTARIAVVSGNKPVVLRNAAATPTIIALILNYYLLTYLLTKADDEDTLWQVRFKHQW
jgi:hypothetical protein